MTIRMTNVPLAAAVPLSVEASFTPAGGKTSLIYPNLWPDTLSLNFTEVTSSTNAHAIFPPANLSESGRAALLRAVLSQHSTRGGFCWKSLFSEPVIGWGEVTWIPVHYLKKLATEFCLHIRGKYNIWYSTIGLIHVELDYNGVWTVHDVLSLPEWLLVGGTFMEDGLREGYNFEFLKRFSYYARDTRTGGSRLSTGSSESSGSSGWISTHSSTGLAGDKSSPKARREGDAQPEETDDTSTESNSTFLMRVLSANDAHDADGHYKALVQFFTEAAPKITELTRLDMELISRAVGGYCYSACAASSEKFLDDVVSGPERGDTLDTFIRVIDNEKAKRKSVPGAIPKNLHIDMEHISRYPFDGSVQIDTHFVGLMLHSLFQLKVQIRRGSRELIQEAVEVVVELASKGKNGKYMAVTYDLALRLEIDFSLFDRRVYRILDIEKWNTIEEADKVEAEERKLRAKDIERKRADGYI